MPVTITVYYPAGHSLDESWEPTALFCPHCAVPQVWHGGGDDYYVGEQYLCLACEFTFTLQGFHHIRDEQDAQRVKALQACR